MRDYDPEMLLVSVHIPKCAGTSFMRWLQNAFPDRLHLHYPDVTPPERLQHRAGWCVHGHFWHHGWAIGVRDYYPETCQLITVLRDPLEMMISSYFYQLHLGAPPTATLEDWLTQVLEWPRLFPWMGLPWNLDDPELPTRLEEEVVWIAVQERLAAGIPQLARRLGVHCPTLPHENGTPRPYAVHRECWEARFREKFASEYRLYDHIEGIAP